MLPICIITIKCSQSEKRLNAPIRKTNNKCSQSEKTIKCSQSQKSRCSQSEKQLNVPNPKTNKMLPI